MQVELRAPITGILIGRIDERRVGSDFDIRSILHRHTVIIDINEYPRRFNYYQNTGLFTAVERRRSVKW